MKKILNIYIATALFMAVILSGCKKNTDTNTVNIPANLTKVASGYAPGANAKVEVYANGDIMAGYNRVYIVLYDSTTGSAITEAHVTLTAQTMSDTGMYMSYAESPSTMMADENGLFEGAIMFDKADGISSHCMFNVDVHNMQTNTMGMYMTHFDATEASPARQYHVTTMDNSSKMVVSLIQPATAQTGSNDFEIGVYKYGMMGVIPDSSYSIEIQPIMTMMGHSSPNNVNPTYMGNGHYMGKVNFTMSGEWRVHVTLMNNGAVADSTGYFDINI